MELGVRRIFCAKVLTGLPALGSKDPLAEGLSVARPLGVVGVKADLFLAARGQSSFYKRVIGCVLTS